MRATVYLVLTPGPMTWDTKRGMRVPTLSVSRMTKGQPRLRGGQIALRLHVELPEDAFTQWIPEASITVAQPDVKVQPVVELGEAPE